MMAQDSAAMERWFRPSFSPPAGATAAPPAWPPPAIDAPVVDPRMFPQRLYHQVDDLGVFELRSVTPRISKLSDLRLVNQTGLLIFFVVTSLDADVTVQVVGADTPDPSLSQLHIGSMLGANTPIAQRDQKSVIVPMRDNGYPWMGLLITPGAAPSVGSIQVRSSYQRWTV